MRVALVTPGGVDPTAEERSWFYREVLRLLSARDDVPAAIVDELRSLTRPAS